MCPVSGEYGWPSSSGIRVGLERIVLRDKSLPTGGGWGYRVGRYSTQQGPDAKGPEALGVALRGGIEDQD